MVLSGTKQEIQEQRAALGVERREVVSRLLDLCAGQGEDDWFYGLFVRPIWHGGPKGTREAQEKLQSAWWIEREDLLQHVLLKIWQHRISSHSEFRQLIAYILRDHLIHDQKIFSRQAGWESRYEHEVELRGNGRDCPPGLGSLLSGEFREELSWYDRYLFYLSYILGFPRKRVAEILLAQRRQVNRLQVKLKQKIKDGGSYE